MNELLETIEGKIDAFKREARKAADGNKSAGARSRKASSELAALLKQWRAESIAAKKVSKP